MKKSWSELNYWNTGEWDVIQEKLDDLKGQFNPERKNLFLALHKTPLSKVRVLLLGQDPYPTREHATGLAFSVPKGTHPFPPTLASIFEEYQRDTGLPRPTSGDLSPWAAQGVLLWNAIPSVLQGHPLSHWKWEEWHPLTAEIIGAVSSKPGAVLCYLGSRAREFSKYSNPFEDVTEIITSHPSPRGSLRSSHPFVGSHLFTRINAALVAKGKEPIDWRL